MIMAIVTNLLHLSYLVKHERSVPNYIKCSSFCSVPKHFYKLTLYRVKVLTLYRAKVPGSFGTEQLNKCLIVSRIWKYEKILTNYYRIIKSSFLPVFPIERTIEI